MGFVRGWLRGISTAVGLGEGMHMLCVGGIMGMVGNPRTHIQVKQWWRWGRVGQVVKHTAMLFGLQMVV